MAVPPPLIHADGLDAAASKATLRAELRRRRLAFACTPDAPAHNAALIGRLPPLPDRGGPIAGYVAHRGEPDVLPYLRRAHEAGIVIALPLVGGGQRMRFVAWHPDMALTPGPLGIPQPAGGVSRADEIVPAVVLTPLVGFDRGGRRLGQGAGYYDRWFADHPAARRIGIAWSVQEVPALPCDDWDMPLHIIVTEKGRIAP